MFQMAGKVRNRVGHNTPDCTCVVLICCWDRPRAAELHGLHWIAVGAPVHTGLYYSPGEDSVGPSILWCLLFAVTLQADYLDSVGTGVFVIFDTFDLVVPEAVVNGDTTASVYQNTDSIYLVVGADAVLVQAFSHYVALGTAAVAAVGSCIRIGGEQVVLDLGLAVPAIVEMAEPGVSR